MAAAAPGKQAACWQASAAKSGGAAADFTFLPQKERWN
jgi:hypothetical protein